MRYRFSLLGKSCGFKRKYQTLREARQAGQQSMTKAGQQLYTYDCFLGGVRHWHLTHKSGGSSKPLGRVETTGRAKALETAR